MIRVYVNDIRCSLENKCYFSALALALALPDICGMAEFPDKSVSGRYIEWYDKYLGADMEYGKDYSGGSSPWLSGEVVYNLRNTYIHQGNPGIASDRVKEEANQLDKFTLMLGDGTVLQTLSLNLEAGTQKTGKLAYRMIIVDITYLCNCICDCALWNYENNQEKFRFDFNAITQEEFVHLSEEALQFTRGDVYAKILNQKLEKEGNTMRFVEDPDQGSLDRIKEALDVIFSDEAMKQRFPNGESTIVLTVDWAGTRIVNVEEKLQEKREAQVRSFFNTHFKEQIYLNKKEEIIQSVLKSKTKLQVNNNLMKHFSNKEVSTIYRRFEPLIRDLPGK